MDPHKKPDIDAKMISGAMDFAIKVAKILQKDSRYDIEAYSFTMSALQHTLSKLKKRRHVTGKELLEGIRHYTLRKYGPMARTVLEHWGIKNTIDFGEIVFNLVDAGLMRKRPQDTKQEFRDVYDFGIAFDQPYRRSTAPKISCRRNSKKG